MRGPSPDGKKKTKQNKKTTLAEEEKFLKDAWFRWAKLQFDQ